MNEDDLNFEDLNVELLDCQKILKPDKPQQLTATGTLSTLREVGLSEDGIVPGKLREYIAEALKICQLTVSSENLRKVLLMPEVQITLKSAISYATKVFYAEKTVSDKVKEKMKGVEGLDAESQAIVKDLVRDDLKSKLEQEARDSVKAEEPEEAHVVVEDPEPVKIKEHAHFCPKCGWNTEIPYSPIKYTEEDKKQFLYCLLGGTSFEKSFPLLNGAMTITFRSMLAEEEDILYSQLRKDLKNEKFNDIPAMNFTQLEYETALSLVEVKARGISLKQEFKDFTGDTALVDYCSYITKEYIRTAPLKRIVNEAYNIFRQVYMELLNEVTSENFYQPASPAG